MTRCAVHLRFPKYVVHDDGRIVSHVFRRARTLSPIKMGLYAGLQLLNKDAVIEKIYLHRLVAETFHGPAPEGHETRHLDGDRTNNSADNLCWGTRAQNAKDKEVHGTAPIGERHPCAKLTDEDVILIRHLSRSGHVGRDLAVRFSVGPMTISRIINRKLWRHVDG